MERFSCVNRPWTLQMSYVNMKTMWRTFFNLIQRDLITYPVSWSEHFVYLPCYTREGVETARWHCLCQISDSEHTSSSSGRHGNTRHFAHVRFVKGALYFGECTEYFEIPSRAQKHVLYALFPPTHHCDQIVRGKTMWQCVIYCVRAESKRG